MKKEYTGSVRVENVYTGEDMSEKERKYFYITVDAPATWCGVVSARTHDEALRIFAKEGWADAEEVTNEQPPIWCLSQFRVEEEGGDEEIYNTGLDDGENQRMEVFDSNGRSLKVEY